jgi:DICT domain-containing protein
MNRFKQENPKRKVEHYDCDLTLTSFADTRFFRKHIQKYVSMGSCASKAKAEGKP